MAQALQMLEIPRLRQNVTNGADRCLWIHFGTCRKEPPRIDIRAGRLALRRLETELQAQLEGPDYLRQATALLTGCWR